MPQVIRSGNNGTIAALGSEPSTSNASDGGAAIGYAAGLTVPQVTQLSGTATRNGNLLKLQVAGAVGSRSLIMLSDNAL